MSCILCIARENTAVSRISNVRLKQLLKLSKRRETLLAEIQDIDREMVRLEREFSETRRRKRFKGGLSVSTESKSRPKRSR